MKVLRMIRVLSILLVLSALLPDLLSAQTETTAESRLEAAKSYDDKPYKSEFFRVRGTPRLTVQTVSGNVDVYHNPELNGVQVDLYLEREFSLWSGTRNLDNYRIMIHQQGDQIIASVEPKRSVRVSADSPIRFNFVVQTPYEVSTNLRTLEGEVSLSDVSGRHFIENKMGDLAVQRISGEIRIVSLAGNVGISEAEGTVFVKTVNGNVRASNSSGEIRIRTVSGSIDALSIAGTLVSASTSGNISADIDSLSKGIFMETMSGNIDLKLPAIYGYDIQGSGISFDLEGLNPNTITQREQNHRNLSLVIREGGLPVQLSTFSGQIRLSESQ
ncbi:MAG: DUF4097 family beta strand repeat protein [Bacteroidetes bacterium]|nr:DUF4097 family beta strand repeat protein [Bacteroidota bacterium]